MTPDARPPLCADTARDRADPQVGTALHVRRFLLVEHPGPWPFHALEAEGLADVVGPLVAATRAAVGRTLLVRRPGRRQDEAPRRWAVADVTTGLARWGTWAEPADLLAACTVLAERSTDVHGAALAGWDDDPVVLVCAHGRHDACCAVRGRPVAAELADGLGDRVWECSHVGGDRFAANVVVLPDGTFYGGVGAGAGAGVGVGAGGPSASEVLADHLAGRVRADVLRGTSLLPPVAQAAAVAAHARWGPAGARDVEHADVVERADGDGWDVDLRCAGALPARVRAHVVATQREAAVLTCRAVRPTSARAYDVVALEEDVGARVP